MLPSLTAIFPIPTLPIRLVKYIEQDFSHCPPDPNPCFLTILQLGISSLFIAIGIIYLIKNEKRKNRI